MKIRGPNLSWTILNSQILQYGYAMKRPTWQLFRIPRSDGPVRAGGVALLLRSDIQSVEITSGKSQYPWEIKWFKGNVTNFGIPAVDLEAWAESFTFSMKPDSVMCSRLEFPKLGVSELGKCFTGSELRAALNRVRHMVVGPDNVSYGILTKLSSVSRRALLKVFYIL
ncbi:unnamed protein product [Timema podura]|uniref:Uncharacterized protein n=1 Tax=Timema podura TaxID=61482 RepID=A0ABN7P219_TIMPD|nr:unnamed protein product [Timema podura]